MCQMTREQNSAIKRLGALVLNLPCEIRVFFLQVNQRAATRTRQYAVICRAFQGVHECFTFEQLGRLTELNQLLAIAAGFALDARWRHAL